MNYNAYVLRMVISEYEDPPDLFPLVRFRHLVRFSESVLTAPWFIRLLWKDVQKNTDRNSEFWHKVKEKIFFDLTLSLKMLRLTGRHCDVLNDTEIPSLCILNHPKICFYRILYLICKQNSQIRAMKKPAVVRIELKV